MKSWSFIFLFEMVWVREGRRVVMVVIQDIHQ